MPAGEEVMSREDFNNLIEREVRAREQIELEGLPNAFKRIGELADILKAETMRLENRIRLVEEEFAILAQDESHPASKLRNLESKIDDTERLAMKIMETSRRTVTMLLSVSEEMERKYDELKDKLGSIEAKTNEIISISSEDIDVKMAQISNMRMEILSLKKENRRLKAKTDGIEQRLKAHLKTVRMRKIKRKPINKEKEATRDAPK